VSGDTSATGVTFVKIAGTNAYVVRRTLTTTVTKVSLERPREHRADERGREEGQRHRKHGDHRERPAADGDCDERRDERRDRDVRERLPATMSTGESGVTSRAPARRFVRSSRTDEPYAWMRKFIGTRKTNARRSETNGKGGEIDPGDPTVSAPNAAPPTRGRRIRRYLHRRPSCPRSRCRRR